MVEHKDERILNAIEEYTNGMLDFRGFQVWWPVDGFWMDSGWVVCVYVCLCTGTKYWNRDRKWRVFDEWEGRLTPFCAQDLVFESALKDLVPMWEKLFGEITPVVRC